MSDSPHYKESYGAWAGFPSGNKPDFKCCCAVVWSKERFSRAYQCNRKRGFGPDRAYCKQHAPDAVAARAEASRGKYNKEMNARRYEWHGRKFFDALQMIADGHNDARGLAQEIIAEFNKGASNADQ